MQWTGPASCATATGSGSACWDCWCCSSSFPTAGRDELNFSTWDRDDGEADGAAESVREGSMPLDRYTMIHRGARLSAAEADHLVAALEALDRADGGGRDGDDDDGDDDGD